MRTQWWPVCAAKYATSDVLPLDVGPYDMKRNNLNASSMPVLYNQTKTDE